MAGTALADTPSSPARALAVDAGPVASATPMTAMVWLKGRNDAQLDASVASRYDESSPYYHLWMKPEDVAALGPNASDLQTLKSSLTAQGLQIVSVADDGSSIKVSGTAAKIQAAFGTEIRVKQLAGKSFFANTAEPKYQGAHPELVAAVSGLHNLGMQPYVARQVDFSTGQPRAGVPAASTPNPLSVFTNQCFGPKIEAHMTGIQIGVGGVVGDYTGPQYMPNVDTMVCGYTPAQIATHYGLDAVYANGWTGKGQTIVLVDAFGESDILNEANIFSQTMGLPLFNNKNFSIVYPDGAPTAATYTEGLENGWAVEIALDVEWAHALAPDAKIVLVVAPTDDPAELSFALNYAVSHQLGDVISNSYGYPEVGFGYGPADAQLFNKVIKKAAAQGIAVNVATGDSGDLGLGTPVGAASIPADSPFATAVGGTSLDIPSDTGAVEAVWGITLTALGQIGRPENPPFMEGFAQGGGGGESVYLEKPSYQKSLPGTGRQLPDVSAVADPQTGAIIVGPDSNNDPVYGVIGGTSLATPVFSAIWALANQAAGESLGQAAPIIAKMDSKAVTDILPIVAFKTKDNTQGSVTTAGVNVTTYDPAQLLGLDQTQPDGFEGTIVHDLLSYVDLGFGANSSLMTTTGWDTATGWGVPNGLKFINEAKKAAKGKLD